jgi:hypothetical protein
VQRLSQVVARGGNEARLGGRRLLRGVALRAELARRRVDARLEFVGTGLQPGDHLVESFPERAELATARHADRTHAHARADVLHRTGQRANRPYDTVADEQRQQHGTHHAREPEDEPGDHEAALFRVGAAPRHRDDDLPHRRRRGRVQALRNIRCHRRLHDRVHELDAFGVATRFVGETVGKLLPRCVHDAHARDVRFMCRGVGESLQCGAVAGEEREFRAGGKLACHRNALARQRSVDLGNAGIGEIDEQREQDERPRRQRQEEHACPNAPGLHGREAPA